MGEKYSYLSLEKSEKGLKLIQYWGVEREKRSEFKMTKKQIEGQTLYLKVEVREFNEEALCQFSYSIEGEKFKNFGKRFKAVPGRWIGAKLGLFAVNTSKHLTSSFADYDYFAVEELSQ